MGPPHLLLTHGKTALELQQHVPQLSLLLGVQTVTVLPPYLPHCRQSPSSPVWDSRAGVEWPLMVKGPVLEVARKRSQGEEQGGGIAESSLCGTYFWRDKTDWRHGGGFNWGP